MIIVVKRLDLNYEKTWKLTNDLPKKMTDASPKSHFLRGI
jgi:hypothetical protein